MTITTLKSQHVAARAMIERLLVKVASYQGGLDSEVLAFQTAKLTSLLRIHFVQEDCTLYAPLMDSGDPDVARIACDFFEEFRHFAERLDLFAYRWCSAPAITSRFGQYREDLTSLCDALIRRIILEEAYLYPLAERSPVAGRQAA